MKKTYSVKIEFRFEATDENDAYGTADSIAEMAEQALFLPSRVEAKVGNPKIVKDEK